jgi:hypothetical protein
MATDECDCMYIIKNMKNKQQQKVHIAIELRQLLDIYLPGKTDRDPSLYLPPLHAKGFELRV